MAYHSYILTLDPCKTEFFEKISTKTPFPFETKKKEGLLYRFGDPDLILAEWDTWSEIVDSHFGSAMCKDGYLLNFYYSRDDDPT